MDMTQALQFIRWDEQRKAGISSRGRAEESLALSKGQFKLSQKRFAFDFGKEIQRLKEKEIEKDKYVISSFTQSYNQAKSLGEKNAIRGVMANYYNALDKSIRPALDSYIKHSPLSPMEEKHNEFMRVNRPPVRPSIDDINAKNWQAIAEHRFAQMDMKAKYDNFMTGTPFDKTDFVSLGEGNAAMRDDKGRVNILTAEELNLKDLSKRFDRLEGELLASGGWVTSKDTAGSYIQGGQWIDAFPQVNAFTGKQKMLNKPGSSVAVANQTALPASTSKMLQGIISGDEDNSIAMTLRKMIKGSPEEQAQASSQLSALSPGFNFSFTKKEAGLMRTLVNWIPFVGWLFDDAKTSIGVAVTEGTPTRLPVPGFGEKIVFIDSYGRVRNKFGTVLGETAEEASQGMAESFKRKK